MRFDWMTVIPIVVAGIYILASVFGSRKEEKPKPRPRLPVRGVDDQAERPSTPTSNVDKFLEEINRRRKDAEDRQRTAALRRERLEPARPLPQRGEFPRRRTSLGAPEPAQAPRTARRVQPVSPKEVPVVELVQESERGKSAALTITVQQASLGTPAAATSLAAALPAAPQTLARRRLSRNVEQVVSLLRAKQGLRTAVLLNEILGPPLCRRGRAKRAHHF